LRNYRLLAVGMLLLSSLPCCAQITGAFITTSDGVKIDYLDSGKGRPIVFIPGWTMPAEIWQPQIDGLSAKYRVIAIDPRSQGDSDKPADGNYGERRAQDYKEVVDKLKLEKPVLVGWSMGVAELLSYIQQFGTDNVGGVVLVDGFVRIDPAMATQFPIFIRKHAVERRATAVAFVKSMYAKPQNQAYLDKVVAASLKTPTNSAMALMMAQLGALDMSTSFALLSHTPTIFAYEPQLQGQADLVQQKRPSVQLERFDDAGHALFVDDADRFNKMIANLMEAAR
jgi:non-heme chloroperoxidase